MAVLFTSPNLIVTRKTGAEGPHHDPYHYEEWMLRVRGKTVVIHCGLAVWARVDGKPVNVPASGDEDINVSNWFRVLTGYTDTQLLRFYHKCRASRAKALQNRCPTRHKNIYDGPGYPGECIVACRDCGEVLDYSFDRSAIE